LDVTTGGSKKPAIVMLHGAYSDSTSFALEGNMRDVARAKGFLLAYPEATPDSDGHKMWNSGSYGDAADRANVDDVNYIAKVVEDLVTKHGADEKHIYINGLSNGGSMAIRAACERADLFAGLAMSHGSLEFRRGDHCAATCQGGTCMWSQEQSGCKESEWVQSLPPIFECDSLTKKKLPLLIVNGESAPYASFQGGIEQPDTKFTLSYPPMSFMEKYLAKSYGCNAKKTTRTFNNGTADSWTHCDGFQGCAANVTMCSSSAGDWWYGDTYDLKTPCLRKGYTAAECEPTAQYKAWGDTTDSIHLTDEVVNFFMNDYRSLPKKVRRHSSIM
jgi:poly(3-hydroxybutyrate) depolymerase